VSMRREATQPQRACVEQHLPGCRVEYGVSAVGIEARFGQVRTVRCRLAP
jgi:hypothetical protein